MMALRLYTITLAIRPSSRKRSSRPQPITAPDRSVQPVWKPEALEGAGEPPGVHRLLGETGIGLGLGGVDRARDERRHVADLAAAETQDVQRERQMCLGLLVPRVEGER